MYGNEYATHTASSRARANAAADVSALVANENTGGGNVNSASANSYELFKRVMSNTKHKPMMGKLNKQVSQIAVKSLKLTPTLNCLVHTYSFLRCPRD